MRQVLHFVPTTRKFHLDAVPFGPPHSGKRKNFVVHLLMYPIPLAQRFCSSRGTTVDRMAIYVELTRRGTLDVCSQFTLPYRYLSGRHRRRLGREGTHAPPRVALGSGTGTCGVGSWELGFGVSQARNLDSIPCMMIRIILASRNIEDPFSVGLSWYGKVLRTKVELPGNVPWSEL